MDGLKMAKPYGNDDVAFVPNRFLIPIVLIFVSRFAVAEQLGNFTWPPDDMSDGLLSNPTASPSVSQEPSASSPPISANPSYSPSTTPSFLPTLECHDQAKYRSPINALNCSQHNGTDCFEWKHLGLSPFEVEELINNCPTSCDISCGALFVFEANLTFHLLELDNFLSPETSFLLEEATSEYLTKFILEKNKTSRFSLNAVELLSQRRIDMTGDRQHSLRSLQDTENHIVDLEVSFGLNGFFLELSLEVVEDLLEEGIDTFGYMRALRFTNDPALQFVEVRLQNYDERISTNATMTTIRSKDINSSRWKVLLTVFAITGIFCVFLLFILKKNKACVIESTGVSEKGISPVDSMASSHFALATTFSQDSAVRFASTDLIRRTATPISFSGSSESGLSSKTSPNSSQQSKSARVDEEHPLTGVIPPMIVFDNIESTNEQAEVLSQNCSREKMTLVVPYRMVMATDSFRIALNSNSLDALDQSMFAGLRSSHRPGDSSLDEELNDHQYNNAQLMAISESGSTSSARTLKTGVSEREILKFSENQHDHSLTNRRDILDHDGYKIKLQAPRFGKLGLVIQCSALNWPVVLLVKQYSPLYLDLFPGDRILTVDGEDMFDTTLETVTERMKGTNLNYKHENNSLPILIWRPQVTQAHSDTFSTTGTKFELPQGQIKNATSLPANRASQCTFSQRSGIMKTSSLTSIHSLLSSSRSNLRSEQGHKRSSSTVNHHDQKMPSATSHRRCLSGDYAPDFRYSSSQKNRPIHHRETHNAT
jgi:hypothetical protein